MPFNSEDFEYIRFKRRLYLLLFVLAIVARYAGVFYHPAFFLLDVVLMIAFMTQFLPALDRAGYSTGLQITLVAVVVAALLLPIPLLGLVAVITIGVIDHKIYKMLKDS